MEFTYKLNNSSYTIEGNPKTFLSLYPETEIISVNNDCPVSKRISEHIVECVSLAKEVGAPVYFIANGVKYEVSSVY